MRLALKKLKRYQQTVHQFGIYYYAKMIKLMRPANSHMNESTKVHYLMNGFHPSLSIAIRRNYPKIA
ncbi:unnamed protein product [Rotaria sp. Silwood2]|nr:unnamed protein product [Rotaria sp. Silwood2]